MNRNRTYSAMGVTSLLALTLALIAGCTSVVGSPEQVEPAATATVAEGQTNEGTASSPGQVELSETEFDFGTIPNTDPVSQVFQVRNVGQGLLELTGVSTSCGCTTAELDETRLAPGEATDLTVTYDPQAHGGATGEFMRLVYVRTSDPDTPETSLTIRVSVVEPGEISEEAVAIGAKGAGLYKLFMCSCCGLDIGSCTCGMAEEQRAFVDQHLIAGASEGQVLRAMYQQYGIFAFFDQALANEVRDELAETLPADRPVLIAEPAQVDLGMVPIAGGLVSTTFTVRNGGQTDLILTGLQTSCGCTTAVLETSEGTSPIFSAGPSETAAGWSAVLAPDEEASLIITFDPMAHGPDATGEMRRAISVVSNDPLNSRVDVAFDIEVTR